VLPRELGHRARGIRLEPRLATEARLVDERPALVREVERTRQRPRRGLAVPAIRIPRRDETHGQSVEAEDEVIDVLRAARLADARRERPT
jgi:hypothetical protein